jgi:lycopene beta-cyclase
VRQPPALVLVGGGLANGLIALKLAAERPDVPFLLLEAGPAPGGNHTWSFHSADLDETQHRFIYPLVTRSWPAQQVVFPGFSRRIGVGYHSIHASRFADVLAERLGDRIRPHAEAAELLPDRVTLADGEEIHASAVIDGRGPRPSPHMVIRFQSFVGREMRFVAPHGVQVPVIMDASTPQAGGYRFTYVLPFTAETALVEDTGYLDSGTLDEAEMDARIGEYCRAKGWRVAETVRRETGVLPITLSGDIDGFLAGLRDVPTVGLAGAFFHPVTGYSLPDAVRVAELVAALPAFSHATVREALQRLARRLWSERAFLRGLNRMLFLAGDPTLRWRVMQRFYALPEPLVARFYADRLTAADKLRILAGKPPVPVLGAVAALLSDGRERKAV